MLRCEAYADAAEAFERAHELDPGDAHSLVFLAGAAIQCVPQNLEKARRALELYFNDPKVNDVGRLSPADREFRNTAEKLQRYVRGRKP